MAAISKNVGMLKNDDFNQQTECEAPERLFKYTTIKVLPICKNVYIKVQWGTVKTRFQQVLDHFIEFSK